jgi:lipopolysaccharide cholinephosphotransferase
MDADFLKEEVRGGILVDAKRKQLWAVMLDILEVFLAICEKHQLRYFAIDGTLLGAVRHRGFIPWDDDVDIGMPRKDYERFLEVAPAMLPAHLALTNKRNERGNPHLYFSRIRNGNTTHITKFAQDCNINHGIFIDIFPKDGLPNGKKGRQFLDHLVLLRRLDRKYRTSWQDCPTWRSKMLLLPFRLLRLFAGPDFFYFRQEKWICKYDFDRSDLAFHFWHGIDPQAIHDKHCFDEYVLLDFEHLKLRCPAGYDKHLKDKYGDYMQYPPVDERRGFHESVVIDCDRPYTDYWPVRKRQ